MPLYTEHTQGIEKWVIVRIEPFVGQHSGVSLLLSPCSVARYYLDPSSTNVSKDVRQSSSASSKPVSSLVMSLEKHEFYRREQYVDIAISFKT